VPKVTGSIPVWDILFSISFDINASSRRRASVRNSINDVSGSWCSGITSASHAEGPGFKSQWVHLIPSFRERFCAACPLDWRNRKSVVTVWPSGLRRQTQVLVEQSAWVRTPQLSFSADSIAPLEIGARLETI
jgi:hypothetical protein